MSVQTLMTPEVQALARRAGIGSVELSTLAHDCEVTAEDNAAEVLLQHLTKRAEGKPEPEESKRQVLRSKDGNLLPEFTKLAADANVTSDEAWLLAAHFEAMDPEHAADLLRERLTRLKDPGSYEMRMLRLRPLGDEETLELAKAAGVGLPELAEHAHSLQLTHPVGWAELLIGWLTELGDRKSPAAATRRIVDDPFSAPAARQRVADTKLYGELSKRVLEAKGPVLHAAVEALEAALGEGSKVQRRRTN